MQFTGNFDSLNGDDTALLSDINSRARGLRQAVSKDEKHTLSPEAIVRYVDYIYLDPIEPRARTTHVSRIPDADARLPLLAQGTGGCAV